MFIPDDKYKIIVENIIIETVDIIVLNSKKEILLGKRNNNPLNGIYYIPGGRRYKNEKLNDSIIRKTKEELGIDMDVNKLVFLGIYDDIYDDSIFDGVSSHFSTITYVYNIGIDEEKLLIGDKQHSELKFFDTNDHNLYFMVKERIEDMKIKNII